jgi:hypothetical protein
MQIVIAAVFPAVILRDALPGVTLKLAAGVPVVVAIRLRILRPEDGMLSVYLAVEGVPVLG